MKRIKKYQGGSYFRLPSLSSEFQTGASYVANVPPYINTQLQQYITNTGIFSAPIPTSNKVKDNTLKDTVSNIGSSIIGKASDAVSDKIFGDSELGRNLGTIFSSGLNSVGDTVLNNAIKKAALTDGLTKNLGSSVGGAVAGLGANYLGRGITSILGNNAASRFLGQSASTVGGTIGGKILSSGTKNLFSGPGSINPIGLGMSAVGAGLSAATGPSKEYNGTYGSTTKALDTVYDALQAGIGLAPGGQIISGALALNKGLSNLFGSTDGMTSTDAILGSAFMPAPIKWLNMLGSSKTGTFNKQSWQNTQKTSNFMQNAFGDLEDKFSKAREEAGKIYGTFSQGAKRRAQDNIDFSNFAWNKILNMADQNEYQNIRSSDMASINNQRYAQWIQGGFSPLARGKNGMKIFNNSINHNLGQRLLSGAALIDNKQMILSAQNGTKIKKKGVKSGINVDYYDPDNVMSVVANNPDKTIVLDEMTVRPYNKLPIQSELFQGITNQAANEKADEYVNRVTPTAEDLLNIGTLGGLNNLSPTQWARRAYDLRKAIKGNMSWDKFGNNWFYGNNGLVSNKYAQEHPYASAAINLAGDIGAFGTFSALRKLPKYATLMKAENKAAQEAAALNWRDMLSNSVKRTRVGDVEIDNPNLLYHLDRGNNTGAFSNHGAYVKNGILFPGVTKKAGQLDYSWWNKGKPYATSVGGQPMTRLMTATKDTPGMLHVRSQNYPIGQWNGNKGFVLSSEYVSPEGVNVSGSTYTLEPTYGWKRVFKDNPTIKWEDATRTPRITAENAASMTPKQWTAAQDAENTLSGLLSNAKPLVAEENPWITTANANDVLARPSTGRRFQLYKDVYEKEIPKEVKQIYRNAVLPRLQKAHSDYLPLQELIKEGVEKALSKDYTVYPERVFKDAGRNNTAGLAFPDGHIAIKEGYEDYALGHEVRHRLQYSSAPQPMKELKLLNDAYDANFVNLGRKYPKFKDLNLDMEKETLNYDARRSLVGDDVLKKFKLDTQNAIIDDMSDTDVFNAVEEADGYGSVYIDFLRKNNLLTHKKAQQFREAMKHVGAYAAPVGVALGTSATTLYNKSK